MIAAGREKFEKALNDPQSLGDWVEPGELEFEDFKYAVYDVYQEKTGTTDVPDHGVPFPREPSGEPWSEDNDDLEERFPELWEKFGA